MLSSWRFSEKETPASSASHIRLISTSSLCFSCNWNPLSSASRFTSLCFLTAPLSSPLCLLLYSSKVSTVCCIPTKLMYYVLTAPAAFFFINPDIFGLVALSGLTHLLKLLEESRLQSFRSHWLVFCKPLTRYSPFVRVMDGNCMASGTDRAHIKEKKKQQIKVGSVCRTKPENWCEKGNENEVV